MNDQYLHSIARRIAGGRIRTAGRIEFIRDQGPVRRDIRVKDYKWSPDALRNLAKILWATERAQSFGIAALRLFSRMPASEFSPDGLLGGRGYIQPIKEMRSKLAQSIELVSEFSDTLHDEINANHWGAAESEPEIQEIIQDTEVIKSNPDEFVQDQYQQEVPGKEFNEIINPSPETMNPMVTGPGREEEKSSLPQGWGGETEAPAWTGQTQYSSAKPGMRKFKKQEEPEEHAAAKPGMRRFKKQDSLPTDDSLQSEGRSTPEMTMRTVIEESGNYASLAKRIVVQSKQEGSSSIPVETLSGPRVKHIGPGEGDEEFGYYTDQDERPSDDPAGEGFSQLDPIFDQMTPAPDVLNGDETRFKISADTYSWLPGANNDKNLNYYALGISDEDIEWMKQNAAPELFGDKKKHSRPYRDPLWDS